MNAPLGANLPSDYRHGSTQARINALEHELAEAKGKLHTLTAASRQERLALRQQLRAARDVLRRTANEAAAITRTADDIDKLLEAKS